MVLHRDLYHAVMGFGFACASVCAQAVLELEIRPDSVYQTMDNFGTSAAFELDEITDAWDEENLEPLAEVLFSKEFNEDGTLKGIGLSGFRLEIGACSHGQGSESQISRVTARSKCPLNSDGSYDWTQMNAELYWARKVHEYGIQTLIAYSNSPPIYHTRNGLACRSPGSQHASNLRPDAYGDFADYLARIARHYDSVGTPLGYLSPVNEPQWGWTCSSQEGTQWTTLEVRDIAVALQAAFDEHQVMKTRITLGEAGRPECAYGNMSDCSIAYGQQLRFWNPADTSYYIGNLRSLVPVIAAHGYWADTPDITLLQTRNNMRTALRNLRPHHEVAWWQTEYSFLGDGFRDLAQNPTSHELGLYMAKVIHTDLTIGNAAAWQFWETFESTTQLPRYRLVQVDRDAQVITAREKTYWALGHYSRFIRPGMRRMHVERFDGLSLLQTLRDVMPTAFHDPVTGNMTVVLVNYRTTAAPVKFAIPGVADTTTVTPYLSTSTLDMVPQEVFPLEEGYEMPGLSIVTLVFGTDIAPSSLHHGQKRPERQAGAARAFAEVRRSPGGGYSLHFTDMTGERAFRIVDLSGRSVQQGIARSGEFAELDLEPGIYFLTFGGRSGGALRGAPADGPALMFFVR